MKSELVKRFCTPPIPEITRFDLRAIADTKRTCLEFEGGQIPVYSRGAGRKVLLVHGWGSRASHLNLLARTLSGAGFHVFTFDAPAHSSEKTPLKTTSNMFEFGRSIATVARYLGDIHAVIGHSLGAIAALFTVTGWMKLEPYRVDPGKLVLISSPTNVQEVIATFSRTVRLTEQEKSLLRIGLEDEFDFRVEDYSVEKAIDAMQTDVQIIHDEEDKEVPVANAYRFRELLPNAAVTLTSGLGHQKILLNRAVGKTISNFL